MRPWIVMGVLAASYLFTPKVTKADFVYEVELAGLQSFADFFSGANDSKSITIFPFARIVAVQWEGLVFNTENGSFLDEFALSVQTNADSIFEAKTWDVEPAEGLRMEGTYSGSGTFSDPGLAGTGPFNLLADGKLVVSVYESFDDGGETVRDAVITDGKLVIRATAVPEPSSMVIVSVVGVAAITYRRLRRNRMRRQSKLLPQ